VEGKVSQSLQRLHSDAVVLVKLQAKANRTAGVVTLGAVTLGAVTLGAVTLGVRKEQLQAAGVSKPLLAAGVSKQLLAAGVSKQLLVAREAMARHLQQKELQLGLMPTRLGHKRVEAKEEVIGTPVEREEATEETWQR